MIKIATPEIIQAVKDNNLAVSTSGELIDIEDYKASHNKPEFNYAYSLPVGEDYQYYKIKIPNTDRWAVGWVKGRPIPKNAIAIIEKTAFEMVFGVDLTNQGTNRAQWKKVNNQKAGSVIVKDNVTDTANLPNANDESFNTLLDDHKKHNL